jgi:hypothetical protein
MSDKPWPDGPEVEPHDTPGWFWIGTPEVDGYVWTSYFVEYWGA